MTNEQLIGFIVFSFVAAVTPGPSNVLLVATGLATGFFRGLGCLGGVIIGMGVMMAVVAFGIGSIIVNNPQLLLGLKVVGSAFLLWLSWKIATATTSQQTNTDKPVGFFYAAAFQWVNPKSWLVSTSATGTYFQVGDGNPLFQAALFGVVFALSALPAGSLWLGLGARMQAFMQTPKQARIFNVIMGLALAGSVIMILL